ncbi:MAG: hypothetical protein K8S23_00545 [Candidatus Cloacimonetes bacterium]|nr:hypothetical protein [Candidatus Cloacimonadota bacterium]
MDSTRVVQLKNCLIKELILRVERIEISEIEANSFNVFQTPSQALRFFQQKLKKFNDVKKVIFEAKLKTLKNLFLLKSQNESLKTKNPFKYVYIRFIKSQKEYKRLEKDLVNTISEVKKLSEEKLHKINIVNKNFETKIDNFSQSIFIKALTSLNDKIYELAENSPLQALELSNMIHKEYETIEKIFK